jgi:eukaryotic-like serine/threonine-protein kinase
MTILARPSEWARTSNATASSAPIANGSHHYFAFLSYSHRDQPMANWLHQALERFVVPSHLVGRITDHGAVPKRLTPIFRDLNELPASNDLGVEIRSAIAASRFLIVLCSPAAARSRWTNAEIEAFKRARPEGCIFAAIVDGEPFASDLAGREEEECLPQALRYRYDRRGRPTTHKAEPLAADLRGTGEVRRLGFLKLVAGMLGLGLDELVQRDTIRRQRRLAAVAGSSLVGMLIATGLALTAIQARDAAREQRREAEGLVGFMLGDLRARLEPIGRLDALDAVGSRALAYYEKQDKSELSDEALAQRSRALTLMGETASLRGDLDGALRRYREAMVSTAELARRYPEDPQRRYDHAQNVFWVGDVAEKRGDHSGAESAMREYKRLADQMVGIEPGNPKWQMEVKYANTNLGVLLYKQRRFDEASRRFEEALVMVERIAAANPGDETARKSIPVTLAWLADAQFGLGRIDEAIAKRERQLATLDQLGEISSDVEYRDMGITARRALARWLASRGATKEALSYARRGVAMAEQLVLTEPQNMIWIEAAAGAKLDLAAILLANDNVSAAAVETRSACDLAGRLIARDAKVIVWKSLAIECLARRAAISSATGARVEAATLARQVAAAAAARPDSAATGFARAEAYKLLGDILIRQGDGAAAVKAWEAALASWPQPARESPRELAIKAALLSSLGRRGEAQTLVGKLDAMGYRRLI